MQSKQNGSVALVVIASVTAISLAGLYARQKSEQTRFSFDKTLDANSRELLLNSNISNLALFKSLINNSKQNDGSYQPTVYASNYFNNQWALATNPGKPNSAAKVVDGKLTLKTFSTQDADFKSAAALLGAQGHSMLSELSQNQAVEIVRLNTDADNGKPYYVKSIDVRIKSKSGGASGSGIKDKELASYGRIPLDAPKPSNLKFFVKPPGYSDYVEDFGSFDNPLPGGTYSFRVVASGVVHHAVVSFNGNEHILGLSGSGVAHKANNILATDVVIGETEGIAMASKNSLLQSVVGFGGESCNFPVANDIDDGISPTSVEIRADAVGVDGLSTTISKTKTLYIRSDSTPPPAGGYACTDRCQNWEDTYASDSLYQNYLDVSLANPNNTKLTDAVDPSFSSRMHANGGVGVICGELVQVAQTIESTMHMKPSDAAKADLDQFNSINWESMTLKRVYAYMAPSCKRQLVGNRTAGCGCFEKGSLIRMADGSEKKASEIRAGDQIWNPRTGKPQAVKRVIAGPEEWPMFRVVADGRQLDVTGEHPFLTQDGLKPSHKLQVGDVLIDGDQKRVLTSVGPLVRDSSESDPTVWNFELVGGSSPEEHYVLANGIMTGDLYLQMQLKGGKEIESREIVSE